MFAEPRTWVDVESAVREWLRDSVASISRRGFFGVNNSAPFPQIVLRRIGGPDDSCLVRFDVWGDTKAEAASVAADLATAADALAAYTHDGVILHGASVDQSRWLPDVDSDLPRYIVDVTFVASSAA